MNVEQTLQLAKQHHQAGRLAEAEALYRQVLAQRPDELRALHGMTMLAETAGHIEAVVELLRRMIALRPNDEMFYYNLGSFLQKLNRLDEAIPAYRAAIRLSPNLAIAHMNLGNALHAQREFDSAIDAMQTAVRLQPSVPLSHYNLGNVLLNAGKLDPAIAAYRAALALKPDFPETLNNLGNAMCFIGQFDEAIDHYRRTLRLQPDHATAHSNIILTMNYRADCDAAAIHGEALRWDQQHAQPLKHLIQSPASASDPTRRLKIGYVSADLRDHPVAHFLLPLLRAHDTQAFEITAYDNGRWGDAITQRLQAHVPRWRRIAGESDEAVAEQIRRDGIDILIDLGGHTDRNRLLVFAHKPAPVQVSWLGYPGTTGLSTIDWRLTDAIADPPGQTDSAYSERLYRLPACAWCYEPWPIIPEHPAPPCDETGHITFGSFNNLAKVTPQAIGLWCEILKAVPEARFLLKGYGLNSASMRSRLHASFEANGVAADRVELRGWEQHPDGHLRCYHQVDLAFDTFPYNGTTTTCEALWMGVPVLTLAGEAHRSRVGVSLLASMGLGELVADSPQRLIDLAAGLARDLPRLAALRAGLRRRMQASPLMAAPAFARGIESAYREMWRKWCGADMSV